MRRRPRPAVLAFLLASSLFGVAVATGAGGSAVTGTAGTDTSLPATESAVTVQGRGPFADLRVRVNQTRNLLNQAVSVTWSGASPTVNISGQFGEQYLQIMQCWGDDDGSNPVNPGPPPEHCAFGAQNGVYGGISGSPFPPGSLATERIISRRGWNTFAEGLGTFDPKTGNLWRDFVAVDGTRIGNHIDPSFNPSAEGGVYWQNPYFNVVTTNEVAGARSLDNGTGAEFFEVVTGVENAGLGCGQRVQPDGAGGVRIPRCWLVVVPRQSAQAENAGTPFGSSSGVVTSPLAPGQWQHRIAIPLEFNPVDTACTLGDDARRLVGSELVSRAVASWQPSLCAVPGLKPYSFGIVSDAGARQQLLTNAPGAPGLFVVSRPLAADAVDPEDPTVYAPLTLSGITIGFNIERAPGIEAGDDARRLAGVRVAQLNLTPRLVAKLLTQSYVRQVNISRLPPYPWIASNPDHLGQDEDFLRFNPEFRELEVIWRKHFSGLLLPAGNSDAATLVWEYVLADPEARAWLEGAPDEWGMRVNPVYAIPPGAVPEAPSNYPKSDPYCYQAPKTPSGVTPPPLCGTDWYPFAQSMSDAARLARNADDGARLEANSFASTPDRYYTRTPPQPPGNRTILALTDTASANLFGLQMARLSRAGDGGADRTFVGPDAAGLTAAVETFRPTHEPAVLTADPTADGPSAYPLATLTYALVRPLSLEAEAREQYAAFVDYAAGAGQVPGPSYGQLPVGYAPLPETFRTQARSAANAIRDLEPPAPPEETGGEAPTPVAETPAVEAPAPTGAPVERRSSEPRSDERTVAVGPPPDAAAGDPTLVESDELAAAGEEAPSSLQLARTPLVDVPFSKVAVPALLALSLLTAWGALEITKRPRRACAPVASSEEGV